MSRNMNTRKPVNEHIEQPEGTRLELKEEIPGGNQLARTVIAFANQSGGTIYFGVRDEPREIIGVQENEIIELEERISHHIRDHLEHSPAFDIRTRYIEEKEATLLELEIFPGSHTPYRLKDTTGTNGVYIRVGSTNKQADQITLEELNRQAEGISYDQTPVGTATMEDLSEELFQTFADRRTSKRDLPEISFNQETLRKLKLIEQSAGTYHPTVGGYLLFHEHPEEKFPQSIARCTRFKGTDMSEAIDTKEIGGPLISMPDEMMNFIRRHINKGVTVEGLYHEEKYEYPLEALREAVVNAICHREYASTGTEIKLAMFDNRIELTNPGGLPGRLSVSDLGTGISEIRNTVIADIFHQMGIIERFGSGSQKIRNHMEEWDLQPPEYRDTGTFFKMIFHKKSKREPGRKTSEIPEHELDEDEKLIINHAKEHGKITPRKAADLIGKTKMTVNRKLNNLCEKEILVRIASSKTDPNTYYQLSESSEERASPDVG